MFAVLSLIINFSLFVLTVLYVSSHSTYYKYNDWAILRSNIYMVEQKYGKFDLGEIKQNQRGTVAYYIYTDNGPIMPDHMEHYYYMEYDEKGDIYNVYDACAPGGWEIWWQRDNPDKWKGYYVFIQVTRILSFR